jgi:hypothetical protein
MENINKKNSCKIIDKIKILSFHFISKNISNEKFVYYFEVKYFWLWVSNTGLKIKKDSIDENT